MTFSFMITVRSFLYVSATAYIRKYISYLNYVVSESLYTLKTNHFDTNGMWNKS